MYRVPLPVLCSTPDFCPSQDTYLLVLFINQETLSLHGRIDCELDSDVDSFNYTYSNNIAGQVMLVQLTVWGVQGHICETISKSMIMEYASPWGSTSSVELFQDPVDFNVF